MIWITAPIGIFVALFTLACVYLFVKVEVASVKTARLNAGGRCENCRSTVDETIEQQFVKVNVEDVWRLHEQQEQPLELYMWRTDNVRKWEADV